MKIYGIFFVSVGLGLFKNDPHKWAPHLGAILLLLGVSEAPSIHTPQRWTKTTHFFKSQNFGSIGSLVVLAAMVWGEDVLIILANLGHGHKQGGFNILVYGLAVHLHLVRRLNGKNNILIMGAQGLSSALLWLALACNTMRHHLRMWGHPCASGMHAYAQANNFWHNRAPPKSNQKHKENRKNTEQQRGRR